MENQGFEEEHQSRPENVLVSSREFRQDPQPFSSDLLGHKLFSDVSSLNADSHVYEDILLPVVEEVSSNEEAPGSNANGVQRSASDAVDRVSKDAATRSLDREEITGGLRRNLTLPFRRGTTGFVLSSTSSSVRVTNRKSSTDREEDAEVTAWNSSFVVDDALFLSREISVQAQSTALQTEPRPNRRRRKKDCKHCRSKAAASNDTQEHEVFDRENEETVLRKNRDNEQQQQQQQQRQQRSYASDSSDPRMTLDPRNFPTIPTCSPFSTADQLAVTGNGSSSIFTISEKIGSSPINTMNPREGERNDGRANLVNSTETNQKNALIASENGRPGLRVNSIYSQDRWYAKEAGIFVTDVKEHSPFQRAYSLPVRTQTPSSQNRINLRRSVRGEPPPHPARLRKHRHGWTLHLAHPLEASGCTRSLVLLLIALLVLLGIGAVALYIAFEPEKLHIIQQYLKASTNDSSSDDASTAGTSSPYRPNEEKRNDASTASPTIVLPLSVTSTLAANILLNIERSSLPDTDDPPTSQPETETTDPSSLNSTRYCDDCLPEEVCVALVDEEVPICRIALDHQDPTGCAGFCLINKQKCHRLDVDAFRCVEVEHYCLDDEWTCLNTLCIPMEKHCDGHMNCYDHSDEYNCVCDLETHFQCGNETSCLPLEKRCDGKIDCWDAADEINCTLACPSENEFTCSNGQCILKARFCDGLPDCMDGSDEPHGCQGRCNKHEFTCQNSRCIMKGMKCNGIDDCGDGTDERHCKDRFS